MTTSLRIVRADAATADAVRRAIANDARWVEGALRELRTHVRECAILATCERVECVVRHAEGETSLPPTIAGIAWVSAAVHVGDDAAMRLLRIAAGLESRIMGESHVLGQVATASRRANECETMGPLLRGLFVRAARTGRRVRRETALGALGRSYVTEAVERIHAAANGRELRIAIIGSGAMAAECARHLVSRGQRTIEAFTRHRHGASALEGAGVRLRPFAALAETLAEVDVVLAATSSAHPIITASDARQLRDGALLVDFGAPPIIAPLPPGEILRLTLLRLDDLAGRACDREAIRHAEAIVAEELRRFAARARDLQVVLAAHGGGDASPANRLVGDMSVALGAALRSSFGSVRVRTAYRLGHPSLDAVGDEGGGGSLQLVVPVMTSDGYFVREVLPRAFHIGEGSGRRTSAAITAPVGGVRLLRDELLGHALHAAVGADVGSIIVLGHGTARSVTSARATEAFAEAIRAALAARGSPKRVQTAFLDQSPGIADVLDAIVADAPNARHIVVPFLIGGGDHLLVDLPRHCAGRRVEVLPPLGAMRSLLPAIERLVHWSAPGRTLRVGTRSSRLALRQAELAMRELARHGIACRVVECSTIGDRDLTRPIEAFSTDGHDGPFTDELESALAEDRIDVAVHSLKDLPLGQPAPDGPTRLAAVLPRGPADESLVTRDGRPLASLPSGATIGTSSPRRTAQLAALRPDVRPVPLRGAVDARLAGIERGEMDGAILATAGLERLGELDRVAERWPIERFVPEAGQGAIALTVRSDDEPAAAACRRVDDEPTRQAVECERRIARGVERSGAAGRWIAAVHASSERDIGRDAWLRARVRLIERSSGGLRDIAVEAAQGDELVDLALDLVRVNQHRSGVPS